MYKKALFIGRNRLKPFTHQPEYIKCFASNTDFPINFDKIRRIFIGRGSVVFEDMTDAREKFGGVHECTGFSLRK